MRLDETITNIATEIVDINSAISVTMNIYRSKYIDINDIIVFAIMKMKHYYDLYYQSIYFNIDNLINLRLHKGYQILAMQFKKIGSQLIDPFRVTKRIDRLIYRLKLLNNMKIYDIVFVAYLKLAINPLLDSY